VCVCIPLVNGHLVTSSIIFLLSRFALFPLRGGNFTRRIRSGKIDFNDCCDKIF
jgi:hypothetical protein